MGRNMQSLIEDINSDLSKFSDSGLIDRISVRKDIINGLRSFGNDICHLQETVVKVEDGYAELPENFYSLYFAYLCEPLGFENFDTDKSELQSSVFYIERTRFNSDWNECVNCCQNNSETIIRENLYFNRGRTEFYYKNPTLLKLGKSFEKSNIHSQCRNKIIREYPNEITIINYKLQANFNKGYIYIMYNGLPKDEEGEIEIPETREGSLEEYLEYRVKRRLAERLLSNSEAPGLASLYPIFRQMEISTKQDASNHVKMKSLTPQGLMKIQRLNRLESLQYENRIQWPLREI